MNNKIKEQIESYFNGNITDFKQYLQKCTKKELLLTIITMKEEGYTEDGYYSIINNIYRLLEV